MKIIQSNNSPYNEVSQVNSLRWKSLFKTGEDFKDTSGWWKCKDFLNDTVAFFNAGWKFSIYGYKNDIPANSEGVYFLLKNIGDKELFLKNLEVVNKRMNEDLGEVVGYIPLEAEDQAIVLLAPGLWKSTYRISLITMLIRLCNYDQKFDSWDSIWKKGAVVYTDGAFDDKAIKFVKENGFNVLDDFKKYWYYAGPEANSDKPKPNYECLIHDCGVCTWVQWMNSSIKKKVPVAA